MKNTLMVLTVLLLSGPVLAQNDASVIYPKLDSFLRSEKANHGLLVRLNIKHWEYRRFKELYDQLCHPNKKSVTKPGTFMDGPVVYSMALPVEISRNANTLYQQYSASITEPSAALMLLGLVGGITAVAVTSKNHHYSALDSESPLGAYLQSTYHQDHRQ